MTNVDLFIVIVTFTPYTFENDRYVTTMTRDDYLVFRNYIKFHFPKGFQFYEYLIAWNVTPKQMEKFNNLESHWTAIQGVLEHTGNNGASVWKKIHSMEKVFEELLSRNTINTS